MSEQTHTPGPWTAIRNCSFWEVQPVNGGEEGIPFCIGDVCASEPGDPDSGRQEANARLFAAAPDLLEALKEAIDSLRYVNDALPETSGYGVRHERIEKGLSAINKAEGR